MDPKNMKVIKLKSILKSRGASTTGNKDILVKRVSEILDIEQAEAVRDESNIKVKTEVTSPPKAVPQAMEQDTSTEKGPTKMEEEEPPSVESESVTTNGAEPGRLKRKNTGDGQHPKKKKVKGPPLPKTPAVILNELQPGTQYTMISENKDVPWFVSEVEFKGEKFLGGGQSKRDSKQSAAANALGSVVQYLEPHRVLPFVTNFDRNAMDFTSDNVEGANMVPFEETNVDPFKPIARQAPTPKPVKNPNAIPGKHPVQLLNEMMPGLVYECVGEVPVFTIEVTVNENKYQGFGKSKKNAKVGAAIKALRNEFNIVISSPEHETIPSNVESEDSSPIQISGNLPDLIFSLIRDKFTELVGGSSTDISNYKVLAGIVMTRGSDSDGEVISLATGTKCIGGEYISDQGSSLFDCHAEIVSRRGLRRYLYDQLLGVTNGEHTILEPYIDGGYRLRDGIDFHLYINTAPCGDARLFAPHETAANANDNHPNRRSRGQLRTKIENGEGTIPVDAAALVQERGKGNVQQTWDAVISGERLLTMSCSDKIAKWNVLGVQGSLLSLYVQPIYLSSIILGSLYHCQHLQRGVFTRAKKAVESAMSVQDGPGLTHPYRVHRPALAAVPNQRRREAKKAPTYCAHWTTGDEEAKVINTATGRDYDGLSSNLCKAEMMKLLKQVMSRGGLKPRSNLPNTHQMTYAQLKALATEYQAAKYLLMTGFHKVEFGAWVGKPDEVDQFICSDEPTQ